MVLPGGVSVMITLYQMDNPVHDDPLPDEGTPPCMITLYQMHAMSGE